MTFKGFRERALARADALSARADRMDAELASEKAARVEDAAAGHDEVASYELERLRAKARGLGEDHDDLCARAEAVGLPVPWRDGTTGGKAATAWRASMLTLHPLSAGSADGVQSNPYEVWRARIVIEERIAAKVARGERVSRWDRAQRLTARVAST